jgi:hypothetical protein
MPSGLCWCHAMLSFTIEIKRGAGAEGNGFLNMVAIEIGIS